MKISAIGMVCVWLGLLCMLCMTSPALACAGLPNVQRNIRTPIPQAVCDALVEYKAFLDRAPPSTRTLTFYGGFAGFHDRLRGLYVLFWLALATKQKISVVNLFGSKNKWPPQHLQTSWLAAGDVDVLPSVWPSAKDQQDIAILTSSMPHSCSSLRDLVVANATDARPFISTNVYWSLCDVQTRDLFPPAIRSACLSEGCLGVMFHFLFSYAGQIGQAPLIASSMLSMLEVGSAKRFAYLLRSGSTRVSFSGAENVKLTTFGDSVAHEAEIQFLIDNIHRCPPTDVPVIVASDSALLKAIISQRARFPTLSCCTNPSHVQSAAASSPHRTIAQMFVDIELISHATNVLSLGGGFPALPRFWHSYGRAFNTTRLVPDMPLHAFCPPVS